MEDYKQEIVNTRVGCLGSSDAKLLRQISHFGVVPRAAYKRLAVVKGLIEGMGTPYTDAMRFGDEIEQAIFNYLKATDERYESNPCIVSKMYSRKNVKCISHPDIVLKDESSKIINLYEVKASKDDTDVVRHEYKAQLYHHFLLGREYALECGRDWRVKVYLVHYNTKGLDLTQPHEFDAERLTIRHIKFSAPVMDLGYAMDIVDRFLETFTEFYEGDEVDFALLPVNVQEQFTAITTMLNEIKEREQKIADFKEKLYQFLVDKNVKSIKNDSFSITRVDPSTSKSFDWKSYLESIASQHPRLYKKLWAQYEKKTEKKGYVTIKLK